MYWYSGDTIEIIDKVVFVNGKNSGVHFIKYYKGRYGNYLKPLPKGMLNQESFPKECHGMKIIMVLW